MEIKYFELSYLAALPTPRLLAYYKKTLPRVRKYQESFYCHCCGIPLFEIDSKYFTKEENEQRRADNKADLEKSESYLVSIQILLEKREHVPRKKK